MHTFDALSEKFNPYNMYTSILHTHVLVVSLFLLYYLIKAVLLFANKPVTLQNMSAKFRIAEMIVSVLFLLTGLYLAINTGNTGSWLWVKLIAVFLSIPLAVIGFKKLNKGFALLSLMLLIYAYGISETKSVFFKKETTVIKNFSSDDASVAGKSIYESECMRCHGDDGKLGLSGSKDLTASTLTREERIELINNGKNTMPAYKSVLTHQQVEAVADYVTQLKK